jgi:hypothetical protein
MYLKWTAGATAAVMAASLLVALPAAAAPQKPWQPPAAQAEKSVPVKPFTPRRQRVATVPEKGPAAVSWPAAGEATVPLRATRARAGNLPVWVTGAGAPALRRVDLRVHAEVIREIVGKAGGCGSWQGDADRR